MVPTIFKFNTSGQSLKAFAEYYIYFIFQIESNIVRCPDPEYAQKMIDAIDKVRVRGDSIGGVVTCIARNVPRVSI